MVPTPPWWFWVPRSQADLDGSAASHESSGHGSQNFRAALPREERSSDSPPRTRQWLSSKYACGYPRSLQGKVHTDDEFGGCSGKRRIYQRLRITNPSLPV